MRCPRIAAALPWAFPPLTWAVGLPAVLFSIAAIRQPRKEDVRTIAALPKAMKPRCEAPRRQCRFECKARTRGSQLLMRQPRIPAAMRRPAVSVSLICELPPLAGDVQEALLRGIASQNSDFPYSCVPAKAVYM